VRPLTKRHTKAVTDILEGWFLDHGVPISIRTDGGSQFRGPFETWCKKQGITQELSSAHHHESNGHAECAVREMKKLLGKTESPLEFRRALREWRNKPRFDGLSPAQWYLGRRQRTDAAALPEAYERITDATLKQHEAQREKYTEIRRRGAKRSSRTRPPLEPAQQVFIQNEKNKRWDRHGTIVRMRPDGRSYVVAIEGRRLLRNRRFLRPWQAAGKTTTTPPIATTESHEKVIPKPIATTGTTDRYPKRNRRPNIPFQSAKTKKNRR
jgi:hypothetical protein